VPRQVFAALSAIFLLGYCVYAVVTTWVYPSNAPIKGDCANWLDSPQARWVVLKGCVLDVDQLILESEEGDFETLDNRREGLSTKLYVATPTWAAVWIPIKTQSKGASGLVRAVYRLESKDTLKWLNEFERADERKKEKMWDDPSPIRRLSRPGVLPGKADKPSTEALMKIFGARASPNLLAVIAGDPPPLEPPVLGIVSGILGLLGLAYATRRRPGDDLTAEQLITNVNVSDVKLELGALEELRREQRENRKPP
jgi:hypothetical protein